MKADKPLSQDDPAYRHAIAMLIAQVETMVRQSGEAQGFDAAKWVAAWVDSPLPALGGATPASLMDTVDGRKLIANLIGMSQTGAYA